MQVLRRRAALGPVDGLDLERLVAPTASRSRTRSVSACIRRRSSRVLAPRSFSHHVERRLPPGPDPEGLRALADQHLDAVDHVGAELAGAADQLGVAVAVDEVDQRDVPVPRRPGSSGSASNGSPPSPSRPSGGAVDDQVVVGGAGLLGADRGQQRGRRRRSRPQRRRGCGRARRRARACGSRRRPWRPPRPAPTRPRGPSRRRPGPASRGPRAGAEARRAGPGRRCSRPRSGRRRSSACWRPRSRARRPTPRRRARARPPCGGS